MADLRTTSLSLLLAATLGLAACGGDDATSGSGTANETTQPTSASSAAVQENLPKVEKDVQDKIDSRRERLEKITKDIQSGKVTPSEGQKEMGKVLKEIEADSGDLGAEAQKQAEAAASQSGEKVTELQLDGGDSDK
jgi:hypothetical protein